MCLSQFAGDERSPLKRVWPSAGRAAIRCVCVYWAQCSAYQSLMKVRIAFRVIELSVMSALVISAAWTAKLLINDLTAAMVNKQRLSRINVCVCVLMTELCSGRHCQPRDCLSKLYWLCVCTSGREMRCVPILVRQRDMHVSPSFGQYEDSALVMCVCAYNWYKELPHGPAPKSVHRSLPPAHSASKNQYLIRMRRHRCQKVRPLLK